jgi:hypothetical protein
VTRDGLTLDFVYRALCLGMKRFYIRRRGQPVPREDRPDLL